MATVTSPGRAAPARPRTTLRRTGPTRPPRRVSGPLGGRGAAVAAPRESFDLGGRALALVRGLPDHSVIDRLVRGRAWIPVLGVLLAGIVAMQVEILKLGASTGHAVEQTATLQSQNEGLQANVATLADDQRIERIAAAKGMVMPSPGSLVFLTAHPGGQVSRALGNIHAPDPSGFASQLAAEAAAAAALTSAPGASTSTTTPAAGTSTTAPAASSSTTTAAPSSSTTAPAASTSTTAPAAGTSTTAPAAPTTQTTPSSGTPSTVPTTSGVAAPVVTPSGAAGVAPAAPSGSTGG